MGQGRCVAHFYKHKLVYMEVASSDDVGLIGILDRFGRGLDAQFSFFLCGKEVPPQNLPRVSQGAIL